MTGKRADTLLELMYRIEHFTLARARDDLTDDEFFWEPFTTTWSIRRHDRCGTPNPFGAGEWVADFAIPEPAGTFNEVSHHGTQIGALRDLYAWRRTDRGQAAGRAGGA